MELRRVKRMSVLGCALSLVLLSPTVFAQASAGGSGSASSQSGSGESSVSGSQSEQGGSLDAGASGGISPTTPGGEGVSSDRKKQDPTVASPRPGAVVEDPSSLVDSGPLLEQDSSSLQRQSEVGRLSREQGPTRGEEGSQEGSSDQSISQTAPRGEEQSEESEGEGSDRVVEREGTSDLDSTLRDDDPATSSGSQPRVGAGADARVDVEGEGESSDAEADTQTDSDADADR